MNVIARNNIPLVTDVSWIIDYHWKHVALLAIQREMEKEYVCVGGERWQQGRKFKV